VLVLRRFDDGAAALQCENCNGCFVRVRDWSAIVDESASGHPVDTKNFVVAGGARLTPDQLAETTHCPACGRDMDRFHFGVTSPAVVDVCETHGMWLDAGELATVLAVAGDVAKSGHLAPESAADQAADAALDVRLKAEETEVDRNAEIARANFRSSDPDYADAERLERFGSSLTSFAARLLGPRKRP
jgi:Zn-finger nucleic acid-binding protein